MAKESRRRKKEYIDNLQNRVNELEAEVKVLRSRVKVFESQENSIRQDQAIAGFTAEDFQIPELNHQNKASIPPELADIINHKIKDNWKLIDLFEYLNSK